MIPANLQWAFEEGRRVHTPGGTGRTKRRRLADIVLPSGELVMGYPGDGLVNAPSEVRPRVSPGAYPVYLTLAVHKHGLSTVAFATVCFTDAETALWEEAGEFFTDSGDGCIFDASVKGLLRAKRAEMPPAEWRQLKTSALKDGDGNLVLDESSGANAIVFRTCDWSYGCFLGRDIAGQIACLVIDGRARA
jgi:hypothetical protein